jgi:drug/metabolite transporter (DMT)-like permease
LRRGDLLLLAGVVVCISTSATLVRLAAPAPALLVAFGRISVATVLLLLLRGRHVAAAAPTLERRSLALSLGAGTFLGIHFALWVTSVFETSLVASVLLVALQPLFIALGSAIALGERPSRRLLSGLVVGGAGALLLALEPDAPGGGHTRLGDLYALGGAVMTACYVVCGRGAREKLPLDLYTTLVYGTASALLAMLLLAKGVHVFGQPAHSYAAILGSAVVPTLGGHTLVNLAVRRMPAPKVSVVFLGEPVGSSLLAWMVLGSTPGPFEALGGAVLLAGVTVALTERSAPG